MSDIIDAAAQPAIELQRVHNPESADNPVPQVPARDFVRLAQGFYFVFWGLLLTVLTGAQLFMLIGIRTSTESFLGAGVLATLIGSWRLYQVRSLGERWRNRTRVVLALAALLTYFCVCFCLWRRVPDNAYLLGNALAFVATGIFYVIAFNHAIAALGMALGRRDMAFESHVLSASNAALLLLPFACVIAYLMGMAVIRHSNPLTELQLVLDHVNLLVVILLLLPFSLTLSLAWGCKDAVLRQLAAFDRKRQQDSGPT
jgi:hypothetical protein